MVRMRRRLKRNEAMTRMTNAAGTAKNGSTALIDVASIGCFAANIAYTTTGMMRNKNRYGTPRAYHTMDDENNRRDGVNDDSDDA